MEYDRGTADAPYDNAHDIAAPTALQARAPRGRAAAENEYDNHILQGVQAESRRCTTPEGPYYSNIADAGSSDNDTAPAAHAATQQRPNDSHIADPALGNRESGDNCHPYNNSVDGEYDNSLTQYHNLHHIVGDSGAQSQERGLELGNEALCTGETFHATALEAVNPTMGALLAQANEHNLRLSASQFVFRGVVGEGHFGTVAKAKLVPTGVEDHGTNGIMSIVFLTDDFEKQGPLLLELSLKLRSIDCTYVSMRARVFCFSPQRARERGGAGLHQGKENN